MFLFFGWFNEFEMDGEIFRNIILLLLIYMNIFMEREYF